MFYCHNTSIYQFFCYIHNIVLLDKRIIILVVFMLNTVIPPDSGYAFFKISNFQRPYKKKSGSDPMSNRFLKVPYETLKCIKL